MWCQKPKSCEFDFVFPSDLFCTYATACWNTNLISQNIKQRFKVTKGIQSWKRLSLSKSLPCAKEKWFYLGWNFIFIIASEKPSFDVVAMFIPTDTANAGDVGLQKIPCYWLVFSSPSRAPCFMRYLGSKAVLSAADSQWASVILQPLSPRTRAAVTFYLLKPGFIPLATGVSGPQWTSGTVFTQLPRHEELVFLGGRLCVLPRPDALRTLSPQVPAHERECENMKRGAKRQEHQATYRMQG